MVCVPLPPPYPLLPRGEMPLWRLKKGLGDLKVSGRPERNLNSLYLVLSDLEVRSSILHGRTAQIERNDLAQSHKHVPGLYIFTFYVYRNITFQGRITDRAHTCTKRYTVYPRNR